VWPDAITVAVDASLVDGFPAVIGQRHPRPFAVIARRDRAIQ